MGASLEHQEGWSGPLAKRLKGVDDGFPLSGREKERSMSVNGGLNGEIGQIGLKV